MKISLITACYNSEATIRTAIDSVLSQKGVDIEYIVVDGGSKDGTVEVVEEFSRNHLRRGYGGQEERKGRKDLNHEIHEYTKTVGRTAILCP